MTWADYAILALIGLSAMLSVLRGFVREALSLLTWIAAFVVAWTFFEPLGAQLAGWIGLPSARLALAFIVLMVAVLVVGALINHLVARLVEHTGLTATDRMLGVVFGVARGVILVALMVLLAGLTPVPRDPWWREAQLVGHFEELALWVRDRLPPEVAENIRYD